MVAVNKGRSEKLPRTIEVGDRAEFEDSWTRDDGSTSAGVVVYVAGRIIVIRHPDGGYDSGPVDNVARIAAPAGMQNRWWWADKEVLESAIHLAVDFLYSQESAVRLRRKIHLSIYGRNRGKLLRAGWRPTEFLEAAEAVFTHNSEPSKNGFYCGEKRWNEKIYAEEMRLKGRRAKPKPAGTRKKSTGPGKKAAAKNQVKP